MADPTATDSTDIQSENFKLVLHRGFYLINQIHSPEEVDQIHGWKTQDSDVFAVTYPKSGTIWMQQILLLIEAKGDITAMSTKPNNEQVPWIEFIGQGKEFLAAPHPRLRVTHLSYKFMPLTLSQRKGKVIYVARNPKDVLVSYYHFHKVAAMLETPKDFNCFFEKFMKGEVFGSGWFEHIKDWCSHKDDINILFITYEEMVQDLESAVKRMCMFLDKELTEEQLVNVVKHSTFRNMRLIPQASYEFVSEDKLNQKGSFMRKGTIGDWKTHFTVAQNERFDKVFQEKMKDVPITFTWDINDIVNV